MSQTLSDNHQKIVEALQGAILNLISNETYDLTCGSRSHQLLEAVQAYKLLVEDKGITETLRAIR